MKPAGESKVLLACLLRGYFIVAAYNNAGLQNISFLYAIDPALTFLHGQGPGLQAARLRYARRYNCHPFFTPMFMGMLLRLEAAIAAGRLEVQALGSLTDTTANSLSAIGDSFFNGSLLVLWALASSCLLLAGLPMAAVSFTVSGFALLQILKAAGFIAGFRKGLHLLMFLRRMELIDWAEKLKAVNAVLLALFLWLALPGAEARTTDWLGAGLYLLAAGWLVGKMHKSRIIVALALLCLAVAAQIGDRF